MKIAIVYTSTSSDMIKLVENELRNVTNGEKIDILTYTDPTIIAETILNGKTTKNSAKRLIKIYMDAVNSGAEIIYNICSSVGDVADAAKNLFNIIGVPIVRIDEEMAKYAIKNGKRIGVLATLSTTLNPTKNLINRCAKEMDTEIVLVDGLADGAFGKSGEELENVLIDTACGISKDVDIILLAQASMASCQEKIARITGKPVVSSPQFGAIGVANVINSMNK